MRNFRVPQNQRQPDQDNNSDASAASDYDLLNPGRSATGQGGEDPDTPEEFPDAHHAAGYQFSGGRLGHKSIRSLGQETDAALENLNGPYNRAGQPALPRREGDDTNAAEFAERANSNVAAPMSKVTDTAKALKRYDETRANFPGEHLIVLAAGLLVLWGAGKRRSALTRMVMTAAGGALIGRAASGEGGVAKVAGFLSKR